MWNLGNNDFNSKSVGAWEMVPSIIKIRRWPNCSSGKPLTKKAVSICVESSCSTVSGFILIPPELIIKSVLPLNLKWWLSISSTRSFVVKFE